MFPLRLCALLLLAIPFGDADVIDLMRIPSDEEFESTVIQSSTVVAVLFVAGTNGEDAERVVKQVSMKISGVTFATADVDMVKAFASEFNVRKRMVPRMLVFTSRARQAETIPLRGDAMMTADKLEATILGFLADHTKKEEGDYMKTILAIGGGKSEL